MSELVSPASIASWPEPGAEMPASTRQLILGYFLNPTKNRHFAFSRTIYHNAYSI
jgi:hypothetical protein